MLTAIRMASRLAAGRTTPIHRQSVLRCSVPKRLVYPQRLGYRSFTQSRIIRNERFIPKDIPPPEKPFVTAPLSPPPPPPPPPPQPAKKGLFERLRRLPWKIIIAIGILYYGYSLAERIMRESVQALLTQFTVPDNTWIYLNLNDLHVTESPHSDRALQIVPFVSSAGKRRMTVLEMTTTITQAAADPRVKGLILAFNESMIEHRAIITGETIESHLGMGVLNELQSAIGIFRIAKRAQRLQQKKEGEHVEPPIGEWPASALTSGKKGGNEEDALVGVEGYHPSQDVVVAIADNYSSGFDYALAAAASRVLLQPTGNVELTGMSLQQFFFGPVLKKYGVDFTVEARREYKSAMSAFTDASWNEPTRQNLEDLVWSLQSQTLFDIFYRSVPLDQRLPKHIGPLVSTPEDNPELYALSLLSSTIRDAQKEPRQFLKSLMDVLNQGPLSLQEAVRFRIVDGSAYHQQLLADFKNIGIQTWSLRKYCDAAIVQSIFSDIDMSKSIIPQLSRTMDKDKEKKKRGKHDGKKEKKGDIRFDVAFVTENPEPKLDDVSLKVDVVVPRNIGLIYLDSAITGKGRFGGEATAAYILKAARDPSIHSIVLRINSPGGDAVASDTIWCAVLAAKEMKPVIASFGDVAASGGYYVAAGADHIFSNMNTITGSIGVISGWPVIRRLLDKVDVSSDQIITLPNSAWRNIELGLPEPEMKKLKKHTDEMYETFKNVVSLGRDMSMEEVEDIAQGQVYTGGQALSLGLVDQIGGLPEALVWAGATSFERSNLKEVAALKELMNEEQGELLEDMIQKGERFQRIIEAALATSHMYGKLHPTEEEIQRLLGRMNLSVKPQIMTTIIPHVNLANEAFGYAVATAFQSEEERSPIQVDQPLIERDDDDEGGSGPQTRLLLGALLGLSRSFNIPVWQFPAFCFWYASQALGRVEGGGVLTKFFDGWFGKFVLEQNVWKDAMMEQRPLFSRKGAASWDIRLEMPPLEIYF